MYLEKSTLYNSLSWPALSVCIRPHENYWISWHPVVVLKWLLCALVLILNQGCMCNVLWARGGMVLHHSCHCIAKWQMAFVCTGANLNPMLSAYPKAFCCMWNVVVYDVPCCFTFPVTVIAWWRITVVTVLSQREGGYQGTLPSFPILYMVSGMH